jgi:hypothetical protein
MLKTCPEYLLKVYIMVLTRVNDRGALHSLQAKVQFDRATTSGIYEIVNRSNTSSSWSQRKQLVSSLRTIPTRSILVMKVVKAIYSYPGDAYVVAG